MLLIISLFALKLYLKYLVRQWVKTIGKWDNFNHYVEERLHLEQFESFEQLKHISLDNVRHFTSMIDAYEVQYQRLLNLINKNLLRLTYRNELTEMLFE